MGKADRMLLSHCHGIEAEKQSGPIASRFHQRESGRVVKNLCLHRTYGLESAELSVEFLVELSFNPESIESSVEF